MPGPFIFYEGGDLLAPRIRGTHPRWLHLSLRPWARSGCRFAAQLGLSGVMDCRRWAGGCLRRVLTRQWSEYTNQCASRGQLFYSEVFKSRKLYCNLGNVFILFSFKTFVALTCNLSSLFTCCLASTHQVIKENDSSVRGRRIYHSKIDWVCVIK